MGEEINWELGSGGVFRAEIERFPSAWETGRNRRRFCNPTFLFLRANLRE